MNGEKRTFDDHNDRSFNKKQKSYRDISLCAQKPIRFDFSKNLVLTDFDEEKRTNLLEKLFAMKIEVNRVKSLLSEKDLDDWSKSKTQLKCSKRSFDSFTSSFSFADTPIGRIDRPKLFHIYVKIFKSNSERKRGQNFSKFSMNSS